MPCLRLHFIICKRKIRQLTFTKGLLCQILAQHFTTKVVLAKLESLWPAMFVDPTDSEGTGRTWAKIQDLAFLFNNISCPDSQSKDVRPLSSKGWLWEVQGQKGELGKVVVIFHLILCWADSYSLPHFCSKDIATSSMSSRHTPDMIVNIIRKAHTTVIFLQL